MTKRQPADNLVEDRHAVGKGWFETWFQTSYTGPMEAAENLLKEIKESFTHRFPCIL